MSARLRRRSLLALKITFSLAVVTYFVRTLDLERLAELGRSASLPLLGVLVVLALVRLPVGAWRFRLLLAPVADVPATSLVRHYFIASVFNQVLPTALGGDAVRVLLLREHAVKPAEGAVYTLAERALGMLALALMAAGAAVFADLPREPTLIAFGTGAGALAGAMGVAVVARRVPADRVPGALLRRAAAAAHTLASSPRALVNAFLASWLFQLVGVSTTWVVGLALDVELSVAAYLALVPLIQLATVAPVSIGGVGLREIAFVYLFSFAGVEHEVSIAMSLGTYASLVLPALVGGVLYLRSTTKLTASDL